MPYIGQLAELPAGQGTLTSDNNAARARHLDLIQAEGIVSERGAWEREPGCTPFTEESIGNGLLTFGFSSARISGAAAVMASVRLAGTFELLGDVATFSGGTTINITTGTGGLADIPSGATIVVAFTQSSSTLATSLTDNVGNTYTRQGSQVFGTTNHVELWTCINCLAVPAGSVLTLSLAAAVTVGSVSAFTGVSSVDEVKNALAAPLAVTMAQPSAWALQDESEGLLVAYGDVSNAGGITEAPDIDHTGHIAFGVGSRLYYSDLPYTQSFPNAILDYWVNPTTQRLLVLAADGTVYKSSGAGTGYTPLTMATVMSNQPGSQIVGGGQETAGANKKAFVFDNGVTKIQTVTGDGVVTTNFGNNWNTTTNIPLDWAVNPPRGGVIHKGRLWCWAPANAPHTIYASKLQDHENFKNAVGGTLEYVETLAEGAGLRIAACVSFKGMLFAFKYPRGVLYLDDTDVDYLNWRWNTISEAVGVADSPLSALVLDDDVLFVGADGHIHFLSAVTQQGIRTSDMTAALNLQQWTRDNVNLNRLQYMQSVWYPAKKLAMIGWAAPASTANDLRMYLDFSNASEEGQTVRISYTYRDVNRVLALRRDELDGQERPIFGDDDGLIWKMDQDSKIKVGVPNAGQARYQYNPTDFSFLDPSLANKRKIFDALTVNFNPTGSWDLYVDSVIDGNYQETINFSMGGASSVLGTFTFGSRLGGGSIRTTRRRMTGSGYWLSLAGWTQGEGHDFFVASHLVNFRVGGEEQRK